MFKNSFQDCVNSLCLCSLEAECPSHFFLHCHYFTDKRKTLFNEMQTVDENILSQSDNKIVELLLSGSSQFNFRQNCIILKVSVRFIVKLERFSL